MPDFRLSICRLFVLLSALSSPALVQAAMIADGQEVVVADFNSGKKPNNLGGDFGCWISDPDDPAQGCLESFDSGALRVIYSVESNKPAFGGIWMRLQSLDASRFDRVTIRVRGDASMGFTTTFKIEVKDAMDQASHTYVRGITDQWQEISIPLSEFKGLANLKKLKELVIVIEDTTATSKRGMFFIDDLRFSRGTRPTALSSNPI